MPIRVRGWGRRGVGRAVVFFRARPREPVRESPIRESPPQDSSARARPREPLRESPSGWVAGGSRVGRRGARASLREPFRESPSGWVAGGSQGSENKNNNKNNKNNFSALHSPLPTRSGISYSVRAPPHSDKDIENSQGLGAFFLKAPEWLHTSIRTC